MVGALPHREPGASGYQRWTQGDLSDDQRALARALVPSVDCMNPEDMEAWAHVAEVLDRPHIPAGKLLDRENGQDVDQ